MEMNEIRRIVADIGEKHGYTNASAELVKFKDFKIRWTRSNGWIDMQISDYVEYLSADAFTELIGTVFDSICGNGTVGYPPRCSEELISHWFCENMSREYLRRTRGIRDADEHLQAMFDDVIDHLDYKLPRRPHIYWHDGGAYKNAYSSVLANVIVVYRGNGCSDDEIRSAIADQCDFIREGYTRFGIEC